MYKKTKTLSSVPSPLAQYARTLLAKPGKQVELPAVVIRREDVAIDAAKVRKYAQVCGYQAGDTHVPLTFPHILAFALHMELLLEKGFPFRLMGMVHINNTITQYKPIPADARLTIEVGFDDLKEHRQGYLVPIVTKVYNFGELIWEERSENLARTKKGEKKKKEVSEALQGEQQSWKLDTYAGIRYAFAGGSGDFNPIHLLPITAKPFGFDRHIIHGMWTKARAVAALEREIGDRPVRVHVDFKLPVYLPATVTFTHKERKAGIDFEVRDRWNEKPHLAGTVDFLDA